LTKLLTCPWLWSCNNQRCFPGGNYNLCSVEVKDEFRQIDLYQWQAKAILLSLALNAKNEKMFKWQSSDPLNDKSRRLTSGFIRVVAQTAAIQPVYAGT